MGTRNTIRDGQSVDGYILAVEGQHDALSFKFRPMLPEIVELLEKTISERPPSEFVAILSKYVADHLLEWSEVEESGVPVPVSPENVRRLRWRPWLRLYRIVSGIVASDPIPNAAGDKLKDELDKIVAEANGSFPGVEKVSETLGNSGKG